MTPAEAQEALANAVEAARRANTVGMVTYQEVLDCIAALVARCEAAEARVRELEARQTTGTYTADSTVIEQLEHRLMLAESEHRHYRDEADTMRRERDEAHAERDAWRWAVEATAYYATPEAAREAILASESHHDEHHRREDALAASLAQRTAEVEALQVRLARYEPVGPCTENSLDYEDESMKQSIEKLAKALAATAPTKGS